ncbi:hypothetical protein [uncultured Oscillibacter sp.]|uniref:hypothetical protein n=3 Tax=uncultured Oscillibacter sp. TaxID=876091 RepID=UPI0026E384B1|nr:hypothetical protein [uncultured Oscillibacter sp.]
MIMFVGQIQSNIYMGNMGILAVRASLPYAPQQTTPTRYDRVEMGTHVQTNPHSGIYKPSSGQMRVLNTPACTKVAPDSRLQAELLPPSEQASYTEEDALINQYMKQYRVDAYIYGDGSESASSEPLKLISKDEISKEDLEKFRSELAEKGLGEEIDWRGVKSDLFQIGVNFDNIERFEQKADYLASRYAVLKDRIQNQFTGDKQEAELQKLEQIYTEAKEKMANSYAESIGGFFEDLGQSGAAEDMHNSVLALVDQKANAYTDYIEKNGDYVSITEPDKQWLKQDDAYMAAQLRQSAGTSSAGSQKQSVNEQAPYDGNDLAFAGIYAKTLSQQLENPTWKVYESDEALGRHLAAQYGALKNSAENAGISEKLSNMLASAFDPFMDRLMDSLDALIDSNRDWVAEKPWMSGMIRTNHIDRESVSNSFHNAISQA